ncbi:MAG: disulfide oxidoreductase [Thermoleophilia bacterium]
MKDTLIATLAALGVLAQIGIGVLVVAAVAWRVSPAARTALGPARESLRAGGVWLAWVVALTATVGSLYFSEGAGFIPCRLCWFQRICMYPLVAVLLVGALLRDRRAIWYALPLPVIGAVISIYHIYIENHPEAELSGCKVGGTSCATKWINEFGYMTIPTLALSAFVLIGLLLTLGRRAAD